MDSPLDIIDAKIRGTPECFMGIYSGMVNFRYWCSLDFILVNRGGTKSCLKTTFPDFRNNRKEMIYVVDSFDRWFSVANSNATVIHYELNLHCAVL